MNKLFSCDYCDHLYSDKGECLAHEERCEQPTKSQEAVQAERNRILEAVEKLETSVEAETINEQVGKAIVSKLKLGRELVYKDQVKQIIKGEK